MGLSNNYNFKNWIDLAANEGKINDGIFAFDLRNTEQITYFYIGSNSFPNNDQITKLTWITPVVVDYWAIPINSTTIL